MKRSGFKQKPRKPMKRTGFKKATKTAKIVKKRSTGKKQPSMRLLKKKLWEECKRIVRLRYQLHTGGWNCYTCGKYLEEPQSAQTGHFIPSSICSAEMRYDLDNLRIQCYRCNINLSGNWPAYEAHLMIERGRDFPEKLKLRNESTKGQKYDSAWYEMYIENYKQINS